MWQVVTSKNISRHKLVNSHHKSRNYCMRKCPQCITQQQLATVTLVAMLVNYHLSHFHTDRVDKTRAGKVFPQSIADLRLLGRQPTSDISHKLISRLPLLSARPSQLQSITVSDGTNFHCLANRGKRVKMTCLESLCDSHMDQTGNFEINIPIPYLLHHSLNQTSVLQLNAIKHSYNNLFFQINLCKLAPLWILIKQEMIGCNGISWTIQKHLQLAPDG